MRIRLKKNSFISQHFLNVKFNLGVSQKICELVDNEIFQSQNIIIQKGNQDNWVAIENLVHFNLNLVNCQCHFTSNAGLPCRHIIALYRILNLEFPVQLIYSRLIQSKKALTPVEKEMDVFLFEEEDDDEEDGDFFPSDQEPESESFSDDFTEDINSTFDEYIGVFPRRNNGSTFNSSNSYNQLMVISKEIAGFGCKNQLIFDEIMNELKKIKCKYQRINNFGEITEKQGRRKGRPKKKFSQKSRIK